MTEGILISCNYIWNGYAGAASGGTSRVFLRAPPGYGEKARGDKEDD
jgi:hypothetical protein